MCVITLLMMHSVIPVHAQTPEPIEPHLGYGIHIAPNADFGSASIAELNVDWVKLYDLGQAEAFRNKRVLYRHDVTWQSDWNSFRGGIASLVTAATGLGIDAIEYGNEPNLSIEWGGNPPNAWQYVQVLRIAYTVTKQVNPNMIVVSAGLAPTKTLPNRMAIDDVDFAREMLENGAGAWFDAFGYHPYGYNLPPEADPERNELVFRRTEKIRALMEAAGVYKQIWLTEFGWLRDPAEDGIGCSDANPDFAGFAWLRVPGATVGDYLVRAFKYAHENWPWAGPMFVWNLNFNRITFLPPCDHRRWFGLIRANGDKTPAYWAFARMPRYWSRYQPKLEVDGVLPLTAQTSLACLTRMELGEIAIHNRGYPANVELSIQPVNSNEPPYVEAQPSRARIGEPIKILVNPTGLKVPGQFPVYVNIRATVNGQITSQSIQGFVLVSANLTDCRN